nr:DUF3179 domain-containing protein [Pseudorhodobacter turbinis]
MSLVIAGSATAQDFSAAWPNTDFSRSTIQMDEVMSGGPPKDGIPALSDPGFRPAAQETRLAPREPVITFAPDGATARAYPVRYLMWHEIVNDTVEGQPIAVTFCPLCNTGIVFSRRLNGKTLSFGVSGLLRNSDMVMYDRESESWWQQATGLGIVGYYAGQELTQLPAWMESWESFRAAHPDGQVMDEPNWRRAYGQNPYVSYDSSIQPFLYDGAPPPHGIAPLARVIRVGNRAWPMERVRAAGSLTEAGVTITWQKGQASALDSANIGAGAEVGNIRVRDAAGRDVVHDIPFAFAFHAFFPDGVWMLGN